MILADEIFSTLKGFGYVVEMYGKDGKGPMASAELANYIYAKDNTSSSSVMIRLPMDENSEYAKVVIYKSNIMDEKIKKLITTIKKIALRYGNTVSIRQFGRNIEPKDLAYIPQGEQELDVNSLNENKNIEDEAWYVSTAFETPMYVLANVRHGLVLQNKETKKSVFFQGDDVDHMKEEMKKALDYIDSHDMDQESGDEVLNRVFDAYENVMEDVVALRPKNDKSDQEKFARAWEKQNGDKHRHGVGSEPCKYCGELACDFDCDGSQGDIDGLYEASKYHRYGTTRSSYHVIPEAKKAKVIIRHSKKVVDEESTAARSTNVKNLYVEGTNGERRLIETKSLMCARAVANHVNRGGKLFDDVSNKIIALSEDIKDIRKLKKKYPVSEDASNKKIHENLSSIYEGLVGFMKSLNTSKLDTLSEALNLNEASVKFAETFYQEKLGEGYEISPLARGSVLYTKTNKFLSK